MGETATPEQWLEDQLLGLRDIVPFLDETMVGGLVSYCPQSSDVEVTEYLTNIAGDSTRSQGIIQEYIRRRAVLTSAQRATNKILAAGRLAAQNGMQAYVKPSVDDLAPPGPSSRSVASASTAEKVDRRKSRKDKGAAAREQKRNIEFVRKGLCDCQAVKHMLVNNCLRCGKIVCAMEGEGPCSFCGALVLKEGSEFTGLMDGDGGLVPGLAGVNSETLTESEAKAIAFKDRLVEYNRTAAQRTAVIDDQSDYFQMDGNKWLSPEEKAAMERRLAEEVRLKEERKKKILVTFDIMGRKVVLDKEEDMPSLQDAFLGGQLVDSSAQKLSEPEMRFKANPTLRMSAPVFVGGNSTKFITKEVSKVKQTGLPKIKGKGARTVQHDDPFVEAIIGGALDVQPSVDDHNGWEGGKDLEVSRDDGVECI